MRLKLEAIPQEYTGDKSAMLIRDDDGEPVLIGCTNAHATAKAIVTAVNLHEPMVSVLKVFGPNEMGKLLMAMIEVSGMAEDGVIRFKALMNAVELILRKIELTKENNDG